MKLSESQLRALRTLSNGTESGTATARFTGPREVNGTTAESLVRRGLAEFVGGRLRMAWHSNTRVRITQAGRDLLEGIDA